MSRRKATPEQIAAAKEKRAKVREIAKKIAAMSPDQQRELVRDWPTTIEGHAVSQELKQATGRTLENRRIAVLIR